MSLDLLHVQCLLHLFVFLISISDEVFWILIRCVLHWLRSFHLSFAPAYFPYLCLYFCNCFYVTSHKCIRKWAIYCKWNHFQKNPLLTATTDHKRNMPQSVHNMIQQHWKSFCLSLATGGFYVGTDQCECTLLFCHYLWLWQNNWEIVNKMTDY